MHLIDSLMGLPLPLLDSWGYWVVFVAAFAEALPISFLVPGQIFVFAGGFFVKLGIFNLVNVIWVSALGAALGDLIGYLLGRTYGYSLLKRIGRYVFLKEKQLDRTRSLMRAHAGKTIFVGRFSPLMRAFTPFIAGASDVPIYRFLLFSVSSAMLWASGSVAIGYYFGQSLETAGAVVGRYIALAVALSVFIFLAVRYYNKRRTVFTRLHMPILTMNIAALYLFAKIIDDVARHEFLRRIDRWIFAGIESLENPAFAVVMAAVSDLFSPPLLAVYSLIILAIFFSRRWWRGMALIAIGMGGGLYLSYLIKIIVGRPRPLGGLLPLSDPSFPSTHAAASVIFFFGFYYILRKLFKPGYKRTLFAVLCASLPLLVGLSRLYLQVHWFSDVIAGYSLGLFWATLVLIFAIAVEAANKPALGLLKRAVLAVRGQIFRKGVVGIDDLE